MLIYNRRISVFDCHMSEESLIDSYRLLSPKPLPNPSSIYNSGCLILMCWFSDPSEPYDFWQVSTQQRQCLYISPAVLLYLFLRSSQHLTPLLIQSPFFSSLTKREESSLRWLKSQRIWVRRTVLLMQMRQNQWQWWKLSYLSTECIYYQYRQFLLQDDIYANLYIFGMGQGRGEPGKGWDICNIILKLMYGGLPKGKKVLQRKEEERKLEGHWDRIKNARPNTTGWSFYDQYRVLNNGKKNMINEDKYTQIQRENRLLLEKITNTMNKRAQSVSEKQRQSRSLHGSYRKKQLTNIQIENARLLKRLQEKRSSYQADKMNLDWKKQKAVIRNIANYPLVIKDGSYRRERKRSFNKPLNLDFDRNAIKGDVEMMRIRNIDGITMVITVKLEEGQLTIMSDMKASKTVKIIEIPREEAMEFIELECEGKLENIFDRLRYDGEEEVLYLMSQGAGLEEVQGEEK